MSDSIVSRKSSGRNGFVMKASAPSAGGTIGHLRLCVSGENEHLNLVGSVIGAETGEDAPSIESGETDIENDDVRHGRPGCLETQQAVLGRPDLSPGRAQAHVDQPPHTGGVLDYKHRGPHANLHRHVSAPP